MGFRRVSYGVQDYNEKVQKAIHRIQPFAHVQQVHSGHVRLGIPLFPHDLVFGLPFQDLNDVSHTIEQTNRLMP